MVSKLRIGILGGGFAGLFAIFYLRKFLQQGIDEGEMPKGRERTAGPWLLGLR